MARAVSPVVGTLLMVVVTVTLAAVVGAVALSEPPVREPATPMVLSIEATPDGTVTFVHESGPELDVREILVRIEVDGKRLEHQPPVPFFAATGFASRTTGPFNIAAEPTWSVGERTSLKIASTNHPVPAPGARITVDIYRDDLRIASAETIVRER